MDTILITDLALSREVLRAQLPAHPCCGALVQFEGIVRNHHHDRVVTAIEYECFRAMAQTELERILQEARIQYPVHQILVAHRVGMLSVGEVSLIVLVGAPHRREAFDACEYIINQLKHCVPIWKKEWYADGDHAWIRCMHG